MWFKRNKWKILLPTLMLLVLGVAFCFGGDAPGMQGVKAGEESTVSGKPSTPETVPEQAESAPQESVEAPRLEDRPGGKEGNLSGDEKIAAAEKLAQETAQKPKPPQTTETKPSGSVEKNQNQVAQPPAEETPNPTPPKAEPVEETPQTCTLSVRCDSILSRMEWLDPAKTALVPTDGVIFPETTVTFSEGESVFQVLQRELKKANIHMEFEKTPVYHSAYIEGIANLYEMDCGELSGWMYAVNDWFPNYGCSQYTLKAGDVVRWVYTTDLGVDVGGFQGVKQ